MPKIDAHQHFWKYDPVRYKWITNEMGILQKDFLPEDLQPILEQNKFDGCIAVQSDSSETETTFLLDLANKNDFIKGVVGWVDFLLENFEDHLHYFKQFKKLKGFRYILQDHKNRELMLTPEFTRGIKALQQFNYTYDILIFPDQLQYIKEFISMFSEQKFVIDHIAKPEIKNNKIEDWKKNILAIAKNKNVYCKISGLVTEADWKNWKAKELIPYLDVTVNAFGPDRIIFGSDWPVCLVAASYNEVLDIVINYFSTFAEEDQQKFFGSNAINFYNLN